MSTKVSTSRFWSLILHEVYNQAGVLVPDDDEVATFSQLHILNMLLIIQFCFLLLVIFQMQHLICEAPKYALDGSFHVSLGNDISVKSNFEETGNPGVTANVSNTDANINSSELVITLFREKPLVSPPKVNISKSNMDEGITLNINENISNTYSNVNMGEWDFDIFPRYLCCATSTTFITTTKFHDRFDFSSCGVTYISMSEE
ncbi:unnamed protein product [Lactuca saligna]|uniref:Uncharacterized protein n=1 Tax=Lactuca saligna TaxID=75948 RepID=A0AA36E389_LACSI|nr:unnamed protein product [Lactuca saligna]